MRVSPRLLGDVLTVALRREGIAVVRCPVVERRAVPRAPRRYAVAVVTADVPADADVEEVIRIDDAGTPVVAAPAGGDGLDLLLAALQVALHRAAPGA